jgi:microcin C transport system substrate-binding protein
MNKINLIQILLIGTLALFLTACGDSTKEDQAADATDLVAIDNTQEVLDYYAEHSDFFSFKTLAELPTDLTWENGSNLPEIGSPDAKKGGTEYVRLQDFPRTFRTVGPDSNGSFRPWILDDTAISIAHRHPQEFTYYAGVGESWAIDRESKTVYVKLDPKAAWSDGVPLTADDFMFMFWFYQSDYIVAPWYKNWFGTQYTNITKYDSHTISISIPNAKPDMDSRVLSLNAMPQHFFKEVGEDFVERYQWRAAPTTGAYLIKEKDIKKGRSVTLTRNKDWWAGDKKSWRYRFNADRIRLSVIRDTPKVFEAFKRGDIDQFGLNLAEYWYEKLPNEDPDVAAGYIHKSVFYNERPRPTYGLWINTSQPLLDNLEIRVGINYATNWDLVIEKFFRGDPARMETSSDGYGEFTHPTLKSRRFNIKKALEYFAMAGFKDRGSDGILVNENGQKLAFTLSSGYENMKDILTILKEEAAKAGLEFRVEVLDGTSGWKKVQEKKHDIHFSAFGVGLEMYPRFWETYHSDNAYDDAFLDDGTVNPERVLKTQTNNLEALAVFELDGLIEKYRDSEDKQEMIDLAHKMTEIHHEQASFVPGFYQGFFRLGHWRWVKYPKEFSYKHARGASQLFVHWIDTEMKEDTLNARKNNRSFEPQILVFDQNKD